MGTGFFLTFLKRKHQNWMQYFSISLTNTIYRGIITILLTILLFIHPRITLIFFPLPPLYPFQWLLFRIWFPPILSVGPEFFGPRCIILHLAVWMGPVYQDIQVTLFDCPVFIIFSTLPIFASTINVHLLPDHWWKDWIASGLVLIPAESHWKHPHSVMIPHRQLFFKDLSASQFLLHLKCPQFILCSANF